jgi:ABC-2 type transport system permease protein
MQSWLVARRELREGSRSRGLWVGTAMMLVIVVAAIVVPALIDDEAPAYDVGLSGVVPAGLVDSMIAHGSAVDATVTVHQFDDRMDGEAAVRDEDIDVLVVDAGELVWRGDADESLRTLVASTIQLVTIQGRAAAAGLSPEELAALAEPVEIDDTELGVVAGRSPDDEAAALVMSVLLLIAVATYGQLVLNGVVQEKSSRVVEVLLARMPARTLLAGKVAGIGLLGLAQLLATAVGAFVATVAVDAVDIPAISGGVLAWVVVWFLLGYAIFATAYGAFGSLASRTEDAGTSAAPVTTLLIVAYWASLIAVSNDPDGAWARLASLVPVTAPFAMPARIALGATSWWEPVVAAGLAVAGIAGLVRLAGRIYSGAILRTGGATRLRDAWHRQARAVGEQPDRATHLTTLAFGILAGAIGVAVAVATSDVVIGVACGAVVYAAATRIGAARSRPSR